jgi:hypothetical protein
MVAEAQLVEPLARFFAQCVSGGGRQTYLAAAATTGHGDAQLDTRREELAAEIDGLSRRQETCSTSLSG